MRWKNKSEMGNSGHGHSKYEGIGDYDVFKERWTELPWNKALEKEKRKWKWNRSVVSDSLRPGNNNYS